MFEVDYGIVIAQVVNFLILFFIFKKFISDSLNSLVIERRQLLEKLYKADIYYDQKVQEASIKEKDIIEKAYKESKKIRLKTQEVASVKAQRLIDKANREVIYILESGKREIEKEKNMMVEKIKDEAIDLSIKLNEKLFNGECQNKSFINKQINK